MNNTKDIGIKQNNRKLLKLIAVKKGMSQLFDDNATLIPFTELELVDGQILKDKTLDNFVSDVEIVGITKGKGFAGVMKRWHFAGQPATHGQKDYARGGGSIGAQGEGRVIRGRKMPGHMGSKKVTLKTKLVDVLNGTTLRVKGGVPGGRNSKIIVYLKEIENAD